MDELEGKSWRGRAQGQRLIDEFGGGWPGMMGFPALLTS
jgi:hypothetical protein